MKKLICIFVLGLLLSVNSKADIIGNKLLCNLILKYSQQSPILKIIGNFINEYYFSTSQSISPIHIKQIVEQKQELFCGYNQQDSTEFIIYLLDTIDE